MDQGNPLVNDEISISVIAKKLWVRKKIISIASIIAISLGVLIAFTTPKEWKANTKVFVGSGGANNLGSLSRFAGLAGIALPSEASVTGLNPLVYEDILKSDFFIKNLLETRFYYEKLQDSLLFKTYCKEYLQKSAVKKLTGLPSTILGLVSSGESQTVVVKDSDFIILTREEEKLFNRIRKRIGVNFDVDKSIVSLSFLIQDPALSSQITAFCSDYLSNYLLEYSALQEKRKLEFVKEQMLIKKQEYYIKQNELAKFLDKNVSLITMRSQVEKERLVAENNLAFSVYSSLAQSYEEARISFQDNMPVIKQMGKFSVPSAASLPNKPLIILGIGFLAFFVTCFVVLVQSGLRFRAAQK